MKRLITIGAVILLAGGSTLAQRAGAPAQPQPRNVTISAIPGVISGGVTWTLAWQGSDNADGIVGTPEGNLLFAQEQPKRVSMLDPSDRVSVVVENTRGAGSLALLGDGRIFAAERTCTDPGLRLASPCQEPTSVSVIHPARRILADSFQGESLGRVNDLVVDRLGGAYFTSGGAYYVSPNGQVSTVGENLRTNGVMLSPDEKTLYVTNGQTVAALDVRTDGSVTNQREFARLEAGGNGDGLAVDAAGRLYVTSAPGVQVFAADGKFLGLIPTPRNVIAVAFAGPEKKTLYVVGSGALGPDGREFVTPEGVRNNAKTIYRIPMVAEGFKGRPK